MSTIATQQLRLREFEARDLESLSELYQLEETSRYESWGSHASIDETRGLLAYWLSTQAARPRTEYNFAIDKDDRFIGLIGLELGFGTETDDPRAGFVGYRLHPECWGQGFATQALLGLLEFGFDELHLHRIHSGCVVSNAASIQVLRKAGFREEGRSRESFPIDDAWYDYLTFGVLRSEWRGRTRSR